MACPACGGSDRVPIAPGLWVCTTVLVERVPGPGAIGVPGQPMVVETTRACANQYQEYDASTLASGLPTCSCGTFAVGTCAVCGEPRCGNCSTMFSGTRQCWVHVNEARLQAETRARDAEAAFRKDQRAKEEAAQRRQEQLIWLLCADGAELARRNIPGSVTVVQRAAKTTTCKAWPLWTRTSTTESGPQSALIKKTTYRTALCEHGDVLRIGAKTDFRGRTHGGKDMLAKHILEEVHVRACELLGRAPNLEGLEGT